MCGIFALINQFNYDASYINAQFEKGKGRGPEFSSLSSVGKYIIFGFHRLAINGLNVLSNQPLMNKNGTIILICNGEIYNYKELYKLINVTPNTQSDCEVILHLYEKYGIEHTLQMLDGVFSFVLLDNRINQESGEKIYVARDPYGVRPLYSVVCDDKYYGFASEAKMLSEFSGKTRTFSHFPPGHFAEFSMPNRAISEWTHINTTKYHTNGFNSCISKEIPDTVILENIRQYLTDAVYKRCCTTQRPIACLLSGGLDSSLIAALVSKYHKDHNLPPIETYSIGLVGSEDLKYARLVADYLGTKHKEVILTEQDFINAVPTVIQSIESYDTTTVRASIGNWLLGKYISQHSQAKVIFNGDGSDELCGGYLYMGACPDPVEYDKECRRLLKDIHAFDVLRSDKSISSHGLEPRTPFLDRSWVQYYLSILPQVRCHNILKNTFNNAVPEKYLLRLAFDKEEILPQEVLWRRKEAFSDGVSGTARSLYEIMREHSETISLNDTVEYTHNPPKTSEQRWYRHIFEQTYSGLGNLVPYFWMPKYVEANDASARTLELYNKENPVKGT